jgi:hypothetical protein
MLKKVAGLAGDITGYVYKTESYKYKDGKSITKVKISIPGEAVKDATGSSIKDGNGRDIRAPFFATIICKGNHENDFQKGDLVDGTKGYFKLRSYIDKENNSRPILEYHGQCSLSY